MKQVFHKIMSMLMAFVVLCSTMSFTVGMHYCGDTLVETAIFHKTKGCGMESMKEGPAEGCSITKKDCCTDKELLVEGQQELKLSFDNLSLDQQVFVGSFVSSYLNLFEEIEVNVTSFSEYPPPLIVRQIFKLDESYLI